jgi:hypothetical protein
VWNRSSSASSALALVVRARRELMDFVSETGLGMTVCLRLAMERPRRPWVEQVLPYGLAAILLITPSRRTLTEATREVRLPA